MDRCFEAKPFQIQTDSAEFLVSSRNRFNLKRLKPFDANHVYFGSTCMAFDDDGFT